MPLDTILKMDGKDVKLIIKGKYREIAKGKSSCGCQCGCSGNEKERISKEIGYSVEEIDSLSDANLGLGCGNPTALAEIKEGNIVLDLGSGAGFDAFIVARKLKGTGKVIGVDMTPEMLKKANENKEKYGYTNVEFREGDIEELPVDDASVDVIISNCVINLAPDKDKVFKEAYRVLKPGGRLFASDIVLLEELSKAQRKDHDLISGCVAGALLKDDYISKMENAGFSVRILHEDKEISKSQYQGIKLESLNFEASK